MHLQSQNNRNNDRFWRLAPLSVCTACPFLCGGLTGGSKNTSKTLHVKPSGGRTGEGAEGGKGRRFMWVSSGGHCGDNKPSGRNRSGGGAAYIMRRPFKIAALNNVHVFIQIPLMH